MKSGAGRGMWLRVARRHTLYIQGSMFFSEPLGSFVPEYFVLRGQVDVDSLHCNVRELNRGLFPIVPDA